MAREGVLGVGMAQAMRNGNAASSAAAGLIGPLRNIADAATPVTLPVLL